MIMYERNQTLNSAVYATLYVTLAVYVTLLSVFC